MPTEATAEHPRKDEREFCGRFEEHLKRLEAAGRCEWRPQVRLLHWAHGKFSEKSKLRIDYVARFDDGPLVGIEAKVAPAKAADMGRYLKQCHDYANSIVGVHSETPHSWHGLPLFRVFLALEIGTAADYVRQHYSTATRIMGPFNVGFVRRSHFHGLQFYICEENAWWTENYGYGGGAMRQNTNRRVGSGSFQLSASEAVPQE